jgi:hypothetical protein
MLARIAFCLALAFAAPALAQQQWAPSAQQSAGARDTATAFWSATDWGESAAAYAMLAPDLRSTQTAAQFATLARDFALISGAVTERTVTHINWSQNPEGAAPGIYVAIDYTARYENIDRYCGFIVLRQPRADTPFEITRIEETFLDNPTAQRMGADADAFWTRTLQESCPGSVAH